MFSRLEDLHMWKTYAKVALSKRLESSKLQMQEQDAALVTRPARSELKEARWAVISFDRLEAARLTYAEAEQKLAELENRKVAGLCLVTDEVAARLTA